MKVEDKNKLLRLIEDGHDPEAACAAMGLDVSEVTQPGPKLQAAIRSALRIGTARLRSKVMELALEGNDVRALEKMLERREAKTQQGDGITRVERAIVHAACPHCGYQPKYQPEPARSRSTRGRNPLHPTADEIEHARGAFP